MDTICFFRIYYLWENPKPYIALKEAPRPNGCKAWINSLKGNVGHICWIKIQCHKQTGYGIATAQSIAYLRSVVDGWLAHAGLLLEDFTLSRIDYDYNFYMSTEEFEVLVATMQRLSERIMRMDKWDRAEQPTVYYLNKSRHAQLYSKEEELKAKGFPINEKEIGLCRQEVQCHARRIKYMKREYKLARNWETWVNPKMESEYLLTAEPVFRAGDFYSLDAATAIIQGSSFSNCHKKRMEEMLIFIQNGTMDALKDFASRNTVKKYLSMLHELNVNPLTIPVNPKVNPTGITYIENPFWGAHTNGGVQV